MAHPARLAVLSWLHRRGPTAVGDLVEALAADHLKRRLEENAPAA